MKISKWEIVILNLTINRAELRNAPLQTLYQTINEMNSLTAELLSIRSKLLPEERNTP